MTEPVEKFSGEEGMESRVFDLGERGFSVALVDLDAGLTLATFHLFKDRDAAVRHAKTLVGKD